MRNFLKTFLRYSTIGPALERFYLLPYVKLHYIHSSDKDFHNHPWSALSIIFGWYVEELETGGIRRRIGFNWLPAHRRHKVTIHKPVWTLFINGKKSNPNWSYGEVRKPWEGSDQERQRLTSEAEGGIVEV